MKPPPFTVDDCAALVFSIKDTPVAEVLRHAVRVGTQAVLLERHGLSYNGWVWSDRTRADVQSWSVPISTEARTALEALAPGDNVPSGLLELGHVESVAALTQRCRQATTQGEVRTILLSSGWVVQTFAENRRQRH